MRARNIALQKRKAMSRVGRVTSRVCSPACMVGRPRESTWGSDKTVSAFLRRRIRQKKLLIVGIRSLDGTHDDLVRYPGLAPAEPASVDPLDRTFGSCPVL